MKEDKLLSIITINYHGLKDTCELMETLPLGDKSLEVIVVDNASSADEATVIEQRFPQIKVIRSNKNLGFAGGNNLGIKAAHGKYLFFVNNDTLFTGKWENESSKDLLQVLISRLESSPKIGVVCPKIRFAWDDAPIQYAGYTPLSRITMRNNSIGCGEQDKGQYNTAHPTPYAHGAAMMVKHEALDKVGPMPECYFLYYEEFDWSMMFRRAGYELWYEPAATIFHKESRSTGQESPLKTYYLTRNRLLFLRRNARTTQRWPAYLYLLGPVVIRDILKRLAKGQRAHLKATLTANRDFIAGRYGKQYRT